MSPLHIAVVPSTSIPSGLAAMVAFDPDQDAVGNARLMQDAIADVRYAEVTHAVRDSELDGVEVKQGPGHGHRATAGSWPPPTTSRARSAACSRSSSAASAEYVTVLTALNGSGVTREQLEERRRARRARRRGQLPRGRPAALPDPSERRMRPTMSTSSPSRTPPSSSTPPATRRTAASTSPGLYMVPLKVHFGDQMFRDGVDMTYKEFFAKLQASDVLPTTSQPTAGEFVAVYEEALEHYEHVFSLHISGEMSGTVRAAEQAAEQFDNVYVYDLRTVTTRAVARRRAPARPPRAGLHARRGPRLRRALPRQLAAAHPRRHTRVPASRRPHRTGRLVRRRRVRHQAAHRRRGRHADRLRQGARAQEGHGRDAALRRGAQPARRRALLLHHRRRQRRRAAAHPRDDRAHPAQRPLRLPGPRRSRRRHPHRPGHGCVCS